MSVLLCMAALSLVPEQVFAQSDPAALKRDASRQMAAGRYGEAITLLNQYLVQRPGDAEGYRVRGLCYQGRGQMENAVQDFRKSVSLDPSNKQGRTDLSRAVEKLRGKVDRQIEGYRRELAKNPNAPGPYLEIAKAHASLDEKAEAEKWYGEYLKRTEAPPEEVLRYCELLAGNNHLQKGETVLQQYTQKYPQNADLSNKYGYFLLWLGKYPASLKAFERALALNPSLAEAQQGLDQVRSKERSAKSPGPAVSEIRGQQVPENSIERFTRLLRSNPKDEETRFSLANQLVYVSRFEEASRHLDTLEQGSADSIRIHESRAWAAAVRDSVFRGKIAELLEVAKEEPDNKQILPRLAGYHAQLAEYGEALNVLDRYLADLPDTSASDVRFRYAQYAAWGKFYEKALAKLNPLLRKTPGSPEYQLLRGQVAVWAVQDVDQGIRYLNNVLRLSPNNLPALLAMASAQALQKNFEVAKEYLSRARKVAPASREVKAAEELYEEALRAEERRETYSLLESARTLAGAGECPKAIKKYEEYFVRAPAPEKAVLMEYADAQSCAKNHSKAIHTYDQLLAQGYDFDVALQRAKNILWSGDSLSALREMKRLVAEKPQDFMSSLYLGEAYQRAGRLSESREVLEGLLKRSATVEERELVVSRLKYLPAGGLSSALANFPTRMAFSPPVSYYSDNQMFSLSNYGGRFEVGVTNMLAVGGAYVRSQLRSQVSSRRYSALKGQLFLRFSDYLSAAGSYGALTTVGRPGKNIVEANILYEKPGVLRLGGYFEGSDAAILLYTPHLIDLRYEARVYRLLGSYVTATHWKIHGSFKVTSISDGNSGSELLLRAGRLFFDETFLGYEYMYTDFTRQAPSIPFTNRSKQLYYSPQNLESHCLWLEWQPQKDEEVTVTLGGKLGYMPSFRATVREISGDLAVHATSRFILSGLLSAGSTYRNDEGYTYFSFAFAFYWSFL